MGKCIQEVQIHVVQGPDTYPYLIFLLLIEDFWCYFFKSLSLLGNVSHSQQQMIHPFAVLHSTWFPLSSPFHHLLAV